jgi:hypothetical protein
VTLADQIIDHGPYRDGDSLPIEVQTADSADINALRDELIAGRQPVTTYEEWRVTGRIDGDPYEFTWSPFRNPHLGEPEPAARGFIALVASRDAWTDGPHLHKRTVTVTDWEAVE